MRSHNSRTRCCCAYCGGPSEHETGTCIITMQYGDEEDSCMVFQAGYPPQGNCTSLVEALIMANNVHEEDVRSHQVGSHRRVYGALRRPHTLEELAALWRAWSGQDRPVTWADVKANICCETGRRRQSRVARVECADRRSCWWYVTVERNETFFRTFDFDSFGTMQFGPPLMESYWYGLERHILGAVPLDKIKEVGEIVRKANTGVRRHGVRATVLSKIASAKEEGSDVPGLMMLDQGVDRNEVGTRGSWSKQTERGF